MNHNHPDLKSDNLIPGATGHQVRDAGVFLASLTTTDDHSIEYPSIFDGRPGWLKNTKGTLELVLDRMKSDPAWLDAKYGFIRSPRQWTKHIYSSGPAITPDESDRYIRVGRTIDGQREGIYGQVTQDGGTHWRPMPADAAFRMLISLGCEKAEATKILGVAERSPITVTYIPFAAEYDDELNPTRWNRIKSWAVDAQPGSVDHFNRMLQHLGSDLNSVIRECPDCQEAGISTGGEWLWAWLCLMVQRPEVRLPWLYLYSIQRDAAGKSKLGEILQHILDSRIYHFGERGQTPVWTDHLDGVALMILDELSLPGMTEAHRRSLIDSTEMVKAKRNTTTTKMANYLHFVQTSNELPPIEPGDTRTIVVEVPPVAAKDPNFLDLLKSEAGAIRHELATRPLPPKVSRVWLPMLTTEVKVRAMAATARNNLSLRESPEDQHASMVDAFARSLAGHATTTTRRVTPTVLLTLSGAPLTPQQLNKLFRDGDDDLSQALSRYSVCVTPVKNEYCKTQKRRCTQYDIQRTSMKACE